MNVLDSSNNFLAIRNPRYCEYATSQCVIQQLPYEYSSSFGQGSKFGPEAIVSASHYVEYYDIELNTECYKKIGIASLKPSTYPDDSPEKLMQLIADDVKGLLDDKKFVVSFGAEHSLSYGVIKAFKAQFPDIGVLQLDAHSDLREKYEGSIWSHACVMKRVHELNVHISQVGVRAQSAEEALYMKSQPNIHCWYDKDLHKNDLWMDEVVSRLPKQLYISIDADGFNADVCPSVGTAEPGGLGWYQSLKLLRKVFESCDVKGFDIVELNPRSYEDRTAYNMAQLAYKLVNYKFEL
ncbi:MAG: agmatinase [Bacteroidia bacterium]